MEWYERIKERRIELGLTQQELADMMEYKSKSTINKIELGKNDIPQSKISKFCEVLKLNESQLMGYDKIENLILTQEEKELVKMFRNLDSNAKQFILTTVEAQQKVNEEVKKGA